MFRLIVAAFFCLLVIGTSSAQTEYPGGNILLSVQVFGDSSETVRSDLYIIEPGMQLDFLITLDFVLEDPVWIDPMTIGGVTDYKSRFVIVNLATGESEFFEFPENTYGPTLSPDADHIAYSTVQDGIVELVVREIATGEERVIATDPNGIVDLSWSPDGNSLAYLRMVEYTGIGSYWVDALMVASIHSSEVQELLQTDCFTSPFSWSPDMELLSFITLSCATDQDTHTKNLTTVSINNPLVEVLDLNGLVPVGTTWSPDARYLAILFLERNASNTSSGYAKIPSQLMFYDLESRDSKMMRLFPQDESSRLIVGGSIGTNAWVNYSG